MNALEIAKKVGGGLLSVAFPAAAPLIIAGINEFLPEDKKLSGEATGHDVDSAIKRLPLAQQQAVLLKQYDVDVVRLEQSYETLRTMLEHDAKNQHSTRPKIAYQSFQVVGISILMLMAAMAYQVFIGKASIESIGPAAAWLLAPLVVLLHAYFGILRDEKKSLHGVAMNAPSENKGLLSKLLSR